MNQCKTAMQSSLADEVLELLSLPAELFEAIGRFSGARWCAALSQCSHKALELARSEQLWAAITLEDFPACAVFAGSLPGLQRRFGSAFACRRALGSLNHGLVAERGPFSPRATQRIAGEHKLIGGTAAMFRMILHEKNGPHWGSILLLGSSESTACPGLYLRPNSARLHTNVNWASGFVDGLQRCAPLDCEVAYCVLLISWRINLDWLARLVVVREADGAVIIDEEAPVDRLPRAFDEASSPIFVGGVCAAPCTLDNLVVLGLAGLNARGEDQRMPPAIHVLLALCEAAHPRLLTPLQQLTSERRARLGGEGGGSMSLERRLFLSGNPPGCANCSDGEATVAAFDHCPHPLLCERCANSGGFFSRGSRRMALMLCRVCRSSSADPTTSTSDDGSIGAEAVVVPLE